MINTGLKWLFNLCCNNIILNVVVMLDMLYSLTLEISHFMLKIMFNTLWVFSCLFFTQNVAEAETAACRT